jgi:hypothetical protein
MSHSLLSGIAAMLVVMLALARSTSLRGLMLHLPRPALRASSALSKVRWDSLLAAIGRVPCEYYQVPCEYYRVPCEYYLGYAASRHGARLCTERAEKHAGDSHPYSMSVLGVPSIGCSEYPHGQDAPSLRERRNATPISAGFVGLLSHRWLHRRARRARHLDVTRPLRPRSAHVPPAVPPEQQSPMARAGPCRRRAGRLLWWPHWSTGVTAHNCRHTRAKPRVAGAQRPCVPSDHSEYPVWHAHHPSVSTQSTCLESLGRTGHQSTGKNPRVPCAVVGHLFISVRMAHASCCVPRRMRRQLPTQTHRTLRQYYYGTCPHAADGFALMRSPSSECWR